MGFNDLLESIGGVGYFHILHNILILIPVCMVSFHSYLQNFTAAVPNHHCRIRVDTNQACDANLTDKEQLQVYIPINKEGKSKKCHQFQVAQCHILNATVSNITDLDTEPCTDGWTYDQSQFVSTIISEWDLVCNQQVLKQVAQSIYMAGVLVGSGLFGWLSDRFGRRRMLIWTHLQVAVAGTLVAFLPTFSCYCVFRFLSGMGTSGICIISLSLILEWIPTQGRTLAGNCYGYFAASGQMILAGLAYGLRNWRWLQFAACAPFFLFFLYSWLLLESARWLILKGKHDLALRNLKIAAWVNGKKEEGEKITIEMLKENIPMNSSKVSSYSFLDLFRTPGMRRISCCLMLVCFSTYFAFFALALDLTTFGFSIFLVQLIFGAIDIPGKLICTLTMGLFGRRITQAVSLILSGLLIIGGIFVPKGVWSNLKHKGIPALHTTMAILAKGCLSGAMACMLQFSGELYPTVVRQRGLGLSFMSAYFGSMLAPAVYLLGDIVSFLPYLIYGVASMVAGVAACFLLETRQALLPDTIEEVENDVIPASKLSQV
ncbi:solute carrier family 22 member 6-B-like [Microcaecilia unicolor]|uniref:Solute carrier family 22 member 6-B-like n=1 Tax=Microcaecilia unicolor TaxID=1415580 RepID=A0A6P7ZMX9_9AMPH|nr:solute carrier family 22 member 6-B-like [Microcaecilia unicolor]